MNKLGITEGEQESPMSRLNASMQIYDEAILVFNETGLSPLQLKEQRDELLAVLKYVKHNYGSLLARSKVCEAINNCENTLK